MRTKTAYLLSIAASVSLIGAAHGGKTRGQPAPAKPSAAAKRYEITVTEKGFEPEKLTVPSARPVTFVFTRKTDQTCVKKVVLDLGNGKKQERDLPLGKPVEVAATFAKAGQLRYACGMDMMSGTLTVQ